MRYAYLWLCLVLSIGLTISSVAAEKGSIVIARSEPKPTSAPLLTSTPRPPLDGAKPTPTPTKAPANAVVIINAPPKRAPVEAKKEKPAKEEMNAEKVTEALPQQTPTTDEPTSTQVESSAKQSTPLQVTGFITKNGNIYEVTDKNGVGMIEGRQSPDSDDKSTHVCNYGTVVIYSDVPCDEVTNVHIGEVHQQVVNTGGEPQQSASTEQQAAVGNNNNTPNGTSNKVDEEEFPDFDDGLPQKQIPKRKRVNKKNPNKQRRRNGIRNRPNAVRQGGGGNGNRRRQQAQRLRPQQQQQRRRQQTNRNKGQQQQRRRLQQEQKQMKRRRNQNGNRNGQQRRKYQRGESYNRRRFNANAIYDDDEERRL